jgi:ribosomal protein L29
MSKAAELRKKDISELKKSVHDLQKKLSDARFKYAANQLKNVKEINNMKKEVARSLTIINELEKAK